MANELRSLFYKQYYAQQGKLNFLNTQMRAAISNPQGFSPQALAALRATATDSIATNFQHSQAALNEREAQTGGLNLPSGVNAQLAEGLYAQEAEQQASAQNQISLQNEDVRNQNYWKAVATLSGVAQQEAPERYLSGALDASAGVGALADAATKANQSSFGAQLEGGIASGLGSELTGGNSTGKGGAGFFGF